MDAARSQSPVVEGAITEAFAATRQSDEPELESAAALTQQADCVRRTRWAADSS